MDDSTGPKGEAPSTPAAALIASGFKINYMVMRDAHTGDEFWRDAAMNSIEWDKEVEAHVPARILKAKAVSREINFSSTEMIEDFSLLQRVFVRNTPIEEWHFDFGFVIPGSTNSWDQTIVADEEAMLPASMLDGQVVIETSFLTGDELIARNCIRVYYDP
jgi:retinal rod rhodopsin-sensitive cGMP 3',5'-cyclic phosphodiesterase subunit delta